MSSIEWIALPPDHKLQREFDEEREEIEPMPDLNDPDKMRDFLSANLYIEDSGEEDGKQYVETSVCRPNRKRTRRMLKDEDFLLFDKYAVVNKDRWESGPKSPEAPLKKRRKLAKKKKKVPKRKPAKKKKSPKQVRARKRKRPSMESCKSDSASCPESSSESSSDEEGLSVMDRYRLKKL